MFPFYFLGNVHNDYNFVFFFAKNIFCPTNLNWGFVTFIEFFVFHTEYLNGLHKPSYTPMSPLHCNSYIVSIVLRPMMSNKCPNMWLQSLTKLVRLFQLCMLEIRLSVCSASF